MGRYRSYGNARGAQTYLSRRDEFDLSEEDKHKAYLRRQAAARAPVQALPILPPKPVEPFWAPTIDYEAMLAASDAAAAAAKAPAPPAPHAIPPAVAVEQRAPETMDLFAGHEDEEEEEVGEAPAP